MLIKSIALISECSNREMGKSHLCPKEYNGVGILASALAVCRNLISRFWLWRFTVTTTNIPSGCFYCSYGITWFHFQMAKPPYFSFFKHFFGVQLGIFQMTTKSLSLRFQWSDHCQPCCIITYI